MKLVCRNNGGGGSRVSWLLQNGGSLGCGNSGTGVCWQTVEDGLWFFHNFRVWICWKWGTWEQNGLTWEHSLENQWGGGGGGGGEKNHIVGGGGGGGGGRRRSLIREGGRGETDRKPDFVACSAQVFSGWVVMAWGTESYSGLAWNTYFAYQALQTSALGMGQTVRLGKRNTMCCKSRMENFFYLVLWFLFFICFLLYFMC